jgi:hypothetical protein
MTASDALGEPITNQERVSALQCIGDRSPWATLAHLSEPGFADLDRVVRRLRTIRTKK